MGEHRAWLCSISVYANLICAAGGVVCCRLAIMLLSFLVRCRCVQRVNRIMASAAADFGYSAHWFNCTRCPNHL